MANDFTERLRVWQSEGWKIENTRGGHLKLVHPNASYPIFCASTPSDHRARHNVESEMRRSLGISAPKNDITITTSTFTSNTFKKPKSSSKQKKFVIRYQDLKDDEEYEEYIPLYEQTNSKLRADVWRLNYLRARLQNREISLIQVLKKRFKNG